MRSMTRLGTVVRIGKLPRTRDPSAVFWLRTNARSILRPCRCQAYRPIRVKLLQCSARCLGTHPEQIHEQYCFIDATVLRSRVEASADECSMKTEHSSAYSVPVFEVCTKLLFRCTASAFKVQQQRVTDVCIVFEDAWLWFRSGALGALHAEFATSS
jgi:hypothetical protein